MSTPTRVMDLEAWTQQARAGRAPEDVVLRLAVASEIRALATQRQVRFRITTWSPDRMRDTIDPKGWDLTNYRRNPTVLWSHRYDELPIAKAVEVAADPKGLSAVAEFATREQYPFADTVYQLILGGFLNATSVGFKPLKHVYNEQRGGVDFLEQELLEVSVCPIPANPEALVEGKGFDLAPLQTWLARQAGRALDRPWVIARGATVLQIVDNTEPPRPWRSWEEAEPTVRVIDDGTHQRVAVPSRELFQAAWALAVDEVTIETYRRLKGLVD